MIYNADNPNKIHAQYVAITDFIDLKNLDLD